MVLRLSGYLLIFLNLPVSRPIFFVTRPKKVFPWVVCRFNPCWYRTNERPICNSKGVYGSKFFIYFSSFTSDRQRRRRQENSGFGEVLSIFLHEKIAIFLPFCDSSMFFFHTCYDRGKTTPIIWKNKWWEGRAKHSNKYVLGGSSRDVTWANVNLSFEVTLQSSVNVKPQWKLIPSWNKVHCGIFGLCNQF